MIGVELLLCRTDSPALALEGNEKLFSPRRLEELRRSIVSVQRESVAGRLLLRKLLQERGREGVDFTALDYSPMGKPSLPGEEELHFNISHSGDWAVCAMSRAEVGVDIQQLCPIPASVVRKFTPAEQEMLYCLPEEERRVALCALWSLKEAWCKCTGTGITIPLDAASFTLEPPGIDQAGFVVLCPSGPEEDYALAVCVRTVEGVEVRKRIAPAAAL